MISNEKLYILGCLSFSAMTVSQLDNYPFLTADFEWLQLNLDFIHHDINFLHRCGLIELVIISGEPFRIYKITSKGYQFLREYLLSELDTYDLKFIDLSIVLNALDVLNPEERVLVVTHRCAALQREIDHLKECQNSLNKGNTTQLSKLDYYLHRSQVELAWIGETTNTSGRMKE